jgi:hypothetical protein
MQTTVTKVRLRLTLARSWFSVAGGRTAPQGSYRSSCAMLFASMATAQTGEDIGAAALSRLHLRLERAADDPPGAADRIKVRQCLAAVDGSASFFLYGRDPMQARYRRGDLLRMYSFNILLLPISIAGVLKSIKQVLTGQKILLGRTPKVEGRSAAMVWDAASSRLLHSLFTLGAGAVLAYAMIIFANLCACTEDLLSGLRAFGHRGSR